MRLPDFMCIGAQKSATSWFYAMLGQHPNIWMSPLKELHYFDRIADDNRETRSRHIQLAKKHRERPPKGASGEDWAAYTDRVSAFGEISLEWYREVFSWPVSDDVKIGDITPAYLEISESAVAHARELLGDIKIIVIVRRPLDRELSQLRMWRRKEDSGVPELQTEDDWMKLYDAMLARRARGAYSQGIPRWQKAFSKENFLALPYADIREQPLIFMKRVEDFLEIPNFGLYRMLRKQIHKSKEAVIPQSVIARAAARVAREDDFLKQHFGQEFFNRTK
jgi:hypothetical protein